MSDKEETELVILHLEDNPMDRELVQKQLQAEDVKCRILACETKEQFLNTLSQGGFNLMLVDYQLPSFSGKDALVLAQEHCPDVPFIFLSGVMGEETAIDSLRDGATDYVLKQRMERLVPAVLRASKEAEEHKQRENAERAQARSEARFRVFMDNLPGLAFIKDNERRWLWLSQRWNDLVEDPDSLLTTTNDDFLPPATAISSREIEERVLQSGMPADDTEKFGPKDDPNRQWLMTRFLIEQPGEAPMLGGVAFDITDRIRAEQDLAHEKDRLRQLVDHNMSILAEHDKRLA